MRILSPIHIASGSALITAAVAISNQRHSINHNADIKHLHTTSQSISVDNPPAPPAAGLASSPTAAAAGGGNPGPGLRLKQATRPRGSASSTARPFTVLITPVRQHSAMASSNCRWRCAEARGTCGYQETTKWNAGCEPQTRTRVGEGPRLSGLEEFAALRRRSMWQGQGRGLRSQTLLCVTCRNERQG